MFFAPHVIREVSYEYFARECEKLKLSIENHFKVSITDEALGKSIGLYNKKRRLLAKIYSLRKKKNVPIKASELLGVMLAVTAVPVEQAVEILTEVKILLKDALFPGRKICGSLFPEDVLRK